MSCIKGSESPLVVTHKRRKIKVTFSTNNEINISDQNQDCPANSAIYIKNLCKSYGPGPPTINNFCMHVRKGTIYGLLGSSGCGKTTVLSTVVGLREWDSGQVLVFGDAPRNIGKRLGYVPQECALYDQLTIREMIEFYARLYNMTDNEMKDRYTFLIKLLDLPSNFRLMGDLSGGQRRRASLMVALMHSPDLLILDEPTVGLDPLLRRSIWNHLYKLVRTLNTTVVITTHYIEEAGLSHKIGVMRKGRLLVEDTPSNLLVSFQCNLLEEVVLSLCKKDENGIQNLLNNQSYAEEANKVTFKSSWKAEVASTVGINHDELMDGIFRKAVGFDCNISQNMRRNRKDSDMPENDLVSTLRNSSLYKSLQRIRGLCKVLILTFIRHPIFISLILLLPTFHGAITLATIGTKPRGMNIGIVNHELLNWTTECDLPAHNGNSCDFSSLTCKFLNQMKKNDLFSLSSFDNENDALDQVKLGRSWGYMTFDKSFSQHSFDVAAAKMFATNESLEGSKIRTYLDYSQYIGLFFVVKDLFAAFESYIKTLVTSCDIGGTQMEIPLNFRPPVYGYNRDNYTEFLIPGVIECCLLDVLSVLTSVIFITDRKQGTLSRAQVAGLRTADVIISHMMIQALVAILQFFLVTVVLHVFFDFVINGSFWLYMLICLLSGLCGASIGILLGIVCEDEVETMIFGVFWVPILLLFGGMFWPLESMPKLWQRIAYILPTTLPISSLRSVITRGVGFTHPLVWPGVVAIFSWTVLLTICVIFAYRKFAK